MDVPRDLVMDDGLAIYPKWMIMDWLPTGSASRGEAEELHPFLLPEQFDKIQSLFERMLISLSLTG